jgi:hypothetical protein
MTPSRGAARAQPRCPDSAAALAAQNAVGRVFLLESRRRFAETLGEFLSSTRSLSLPMSEYDR